MAVTPPVDPVILAVPNVAELTVEMFTVEVPMLWVPTERVPMVAVPVDAVKLDPNVDGPATKRVPMVAVPVDAVKLVPKVTWPKSVVLLDTVKDPVLCTPEVDRDRAEEVLSPSVIT